MKKTLHILQVSPRFTALGPGGEKLDEKRENSKIKQNICSINDTTAEGICAKIIYIRLDGQTNIYLY
jgi:hypothetical protein